MSQSERTTNTSKDAELDWIGLREERNQMMVNETFLERAKRKTRENPFVPIGCCATVAALSYGIWSFYKGDSMMSQYMMRARVGAQAFTIVAVVAGMMLSSQKYRAQ